MYVLKSVRLVTRCFSVISRAFHHTVPCCCPHCLANILWVAALEESAHKVLVSSIGFGATAMSHGSPQLLVIFPSVVSSLLCASSLLPSMVAAS